ncbi:MAG: helix-turn-helix transcriptional regulator [Christensenellaceae bacterium]|jgi:transcriptional regulator with XRE-family HTH domain|nr:helix-turn-helix transcriptional regulator [Christensenellaceae bacterium]
MELLNVREAVAKRISELLKEKKMTRYALSRKAIINQATLHNVMIGPCKSINLNTIFVLAEALDMTMVEFFDSPLFDYENIETN